MVTGLTAAALAVVGFLAYQASANAPDTFGDPAAHGSPSASAAPPARGPGSSATALPAGSGTGERVVYGLKGRRVWLVAAGDKVERTFTVQPSTVDPVPGTYHVTSRTGAVVGSDGVPIEHVVVFARTDDVVIGFSSAQDGSMASPDPSKRTGGVRMTKSDGDAMWTFAMSGSEVVVVP
jgi:hypothetical protein